MDYSDAFGAEQFDEVYHLDILRSLSHLQTSVEGLLHNPAACASDLEHIRDQAEEVIEIAARLQSHFAPFSFEFEVITSLKDKVSDMILFPVEGILNLTGSKKVKQLWRSFERAFYGPGSIAQELSHLEQFLG